MCSSGLMYKISETVIYGYPEKQLIIKHEPHFECSKCGFIMQAEPDQSRSCLKNKSCIKRENQVS